MEGVCQTAETLTLPETQITTYILRVEVTPESNPQGPALQKV
jgi:hypothetical protein